MCFWMFLQLTQQKKKRWVATSTPARWGRGNKRGDLWPWHQEAVRKNGPKWSKKLTLLNEHGTSVFLEKGWWSCITLGCQCGWSFMVGASGGCLQHLFRSACSSSDCKGGIRILRPFTEGSLREYLKVFIYLFPAISEDLSYNIFLTFESYIF